MPEDTAEVAVKPSLSAKDEVRALLDRLPDNVTLADIQYHLDVVIKVLESEADTEVICLTRSFFRELDEEWRGQ